MQDECYFSGSFGMAKCPTIKKIDKDNSGTLMYQRRYDNLLLHSWWLLKEPIVVLLEQKVFELFNLRIRTGCVPAS